MLDKELIFLNFEAEDWKDLLSRLSDILYEKGYVKKSFKEAILKREKVFPTGLPTLGVKVALPHTDTKHVLKPAILVSTLKKPISFKEMGNGVNDLDVEIVFLLAVTNPSYQVQLLQRLINMFSKKNILLSLKECENPQCIYDILERELY
ncbi:PTS sugar transporter subunit IIA [Tepidimicrobium xylanilyticum]|uniref:PTS sugar transporter subunit IIA n=1 Tax=Tepidimicrobium xylanilyticum TaxID=1123352 RepID=UPI002652A27E|nr:PTS sugar transporter subunit IIA [Tepidimicrobium xylanilyticum]GMG95329.1 PTS sugar transporter subunit IIA [Tepidimicrobium xylanilyticum]